MRKLNLYLITLLMITVPMLQSCDDGNSLGDFVVRMATVHVVSGDTYYLEIDNGKKLWPGATAIPWYKPVDGQRVWADFTLLSGKIPDTEYAHAIKVNYLYNVLTKTVEELTAENEDEIGDDPIYIEDMWIGGNFLNIQFRINIPVNELHRVSLIKNTLDEIPLIDEEGYICLEYRFHEAEDLYNVRKRSFVSFNLGEYGPQRLTDDAVRGLKVKINSIENGEKDIVFEYKKNNTAQEKTIRFTNDIVNEGTE